MIVICYFAAEMSFAFDLWRPLLLVVDLMSVILWFYFCCSFALICLALSAVYYFHYFVCYFILVGLWLRGCILVVMGLFWLRCWVCLLIVPFVMGRLMLVVLNLLSILACLWFAWLWLFLLWLGCCRDLIFGFIGCCFFVLAFDWWCCVFFCGFCFCLFVLVCSI